AVLALALALSAPALADTRLASPTPAELRAGPALVTASVLSPVLAQAAPVLPPLVQAGLDFLLSPTGIGLVLGALALLLGSSEVRRRRVALATYHAFHIVEDLKRETPGMPALVKIGEGLRAADEYMRANGWRPFKPGEQEAAKLTFSAMHGEQQTSLRSQVAAASEVAAQAALNGMAREVHTPDPLVPRAG
ncbi:MAG: hypothetical protein L0Y66_19975, partial [Myxococcaceae bacterium]|nr:hypothetical protein [Myxococcaceae bacterium]